MLLTMVAAGALAGAGLLLIARGALGTTTPLSTLVDDLHRPRATRPETSDLDRAIGWLAGPPNSARDADLEVCERSLDAYVRGRLVWALLGAAPGLAALLLTGLGLVTVLPPAGALALIAAGAAGGWLYARVDLARDAAEARREFRHALAAYLELVTILMAGGAGVETALLDAAAEGHGRAFRRLRANLSAAQAQRIPPWQLFGDLGERLRVSELSELHASMSLAGGGAQVRESLATKAAGIRERDLAQLESEAQARSETMVLPVALMFAGFLLLIGYPALAALSSS